MSVNENKLRLIDEKLAEGAFLAGVEELTKIINANRGRNERPIGDERTKQLIRELKDLVAEKGIEIKFSKSGGYRYSVQRYRYYQDSVTENEKNLLLIANSMFSIFSGTGMHESFGYVVNKILKKQNRRGEIKDISELKLIDIGGTPKDEGIKWLQQIVNSRMDYDFALEVIYQKSEKESKKKILSPYIIKQFESKWYMVAYDHTSSREPKTNVFSLSKIKSIELSNRKFHIDSNFSVEDYFKYSIGIWHSHINKPITVQFKTVKPGLFTILTKSPLHRSQIIASQKEEILQIEVYNTPELLRLLLKCGSEIKVLSPDNLVEELKNELTKAASLYN